MTEHVRFAYRAFLSYSHRDKAWADWLHGALESYRVDDHLVGQLTPGGPIPKTLAPIFRDREDFAAGHSLTEQTLAALAASQFLVVICSPHAAASEYVNEEIRRFKEMGRAGQVIAIIVDGEPGDPQRECFPPALRFKVGPDGVLTEGREEPIAADARRVGDGKRLALQKVVAGLLGVSFDDIRKRDAIVDGFKIKVAAAAAGVFIVVAMAAGYFYWHAGEQQRIESARIEDQRRREEEHKKQLAAMQADLKALAEKLTANSAAPGHPGTQRVVAEALTAAAKGAADGDDRLKWALNLLKAGKTKEAEPLFRSVAEEKERAAAAINKDAAAAYRHLGAIAGLADPKRAREAYGRAVDLDPEDRDALYWHGWLQLLAGDLATAERDLNRLLHASLKAGDERGAYRGYLRLGEVLIDRGKLANARDQIDRAHEIAWRNTDRNPKDLEWQRDLSLSYEKIGDVLVAQGNLPEALKSYQADLAITDRLATADPGNAGWQYDVGISNERIGDMLLAQGDLAAALKSYQARHDIISRLATADPGNAGWQRDLSVSYTKVGDVQVAQGNLTEALKSYQASLAIIDRLATADPGNARWQVDVLWSYWRLATHGDEPDRRWRLIVETLRKLKAEDKLTAEQANKWLPEAERRLAALKKKQ